MTHPHLIYLRQRRRNRLVGWLVGTVAVVLLFQQLSNNARNNYLEHASVSVLEADAAKHPGDDEVQYRLAFSLIGDLHEDRACDIMEGLVRKHPTSVRYWFGLGRTREVNTRIGPAEAAYRKVLELDPNHVQAMLRLATIYAEAGLSYESIQWFERASALDKSVSLIDSSWAKCLLRRGKVQEAWDRASAAAMTNPMNDDMYSILVESAMALKHYDEAETLLTKRLQLTPMYPVVPVRTQFLRLLLARPQDASTLERATVLAEAARTEIGVTPDFEAQYSELLLVKGRLKDALAAVDRGLKTNANHIGCLAQKARVLQRMGRTAEAGALAAQVVKLTHRTAQVITLEQRVKARPEDVALRSELAKAYMAAGDPASANEQCHEILSRAPAIRDAAALVDVSRQAAVDLLRPKALPAVHATA